MLLTHAAILTYFRDLSKERYGSLAEAARVFGINDRSFIQKPHKTRGTRFVGWDRMLQCLDKLGYEVTFEIRKKNG